MILLTNILNYTAVLFDIEELVPDFRQRNMNDADAIEFYINSHRRTANLSQNDLNYLTSSRLYSHLHMLSDLLVELEPI